MLVKKLLFAVGGLALVACSGPTEPMTINAINVAQPPPWCISWDPPAAELAISAPATLAVTPAAVVPGGTVQLSSWTVTNRGTVASNTFSNGYYLSTDPTITAADRLLGRSSSSALPPGASFTWGGPTLTIPADVPPGAYYVGILVDWTNTTPESCEWNNSVQSAWLTVEWTILFVSNRDGGSWSFYEIYRMNGDGSGVVRLTSSAGGTDNVNNESPAWSPNRTKIAFVRHGNTSAHIHLMNADGSGIIQLTSLGGHQLQPAWSPDGSQIAFVGTHQGNPEIYVMNVPRSGSVGVPIFPVRLTNNTCADRDPAWSPDGGKIAFTRSCDGWTSEIYVMNKDGTAQVNLTNDAGNWSWGPAWSPDGLKIAFTKGPRTLSEWHVYVMNSDGTGQVNLTPNQCRSDDPAWSPDGEKIAFRSSFDPFLCNADGDVYVMKKDGTAQINLTGERLWHDAAPAW